MALAIDASTPAMASGITTAITTAAFSPPAGSLLLALVGRNVPTAGTNSQGTVSGAGLTWTLAGRKTDTSPGATGVLSGGANQPGCADVWWAYAAAGFTSQSITDTHATTNPVAGFEHALQVTVLTGAETAWAGAIDATGATSGAPLLAITTTAANAWVFSVISDWSAGAAGTYTGTETKINEYIVSGQISVRFFRQTSVTAASGTSVTESVTAPSTQQYNLINVEMRPTAGSTGPNPPPLTVVTRVPRIRAAHF